MNKTETLKMISLCSSVTEFTCRDEIADGSPEEA
jgi:hypothetical protein